MRTEKECQEKCKELKKLFKQLQKEYDEAEPLSRLRKENLKKCVRINEAMSALNWARGVVHFTYIEIEMLNPNKIKL